jgi:two-component system chemotaxis response regulator CheY
MSPLACGSLRAAGGAGGLPAEVPRAPQENGDARRWKVRLREGPGQGEFVQRILVVEDSATMRSLIASTLEELDPAVKITEASSGFEALRLLPRAAFDLIVTDINMPDINGLELVAFLKKTPAYARVPLIIVSTEGSERDREKGLGLGADAYVVKPFAPEDLRAVARDLLGASGEA